MVGGQCYKVRVAGTRGERGAAGPLGGAGPGNGGGGRVGGGRDGAGVVRDTLPLEGLREEGSGRKDPH